MKTLLLLLVSLASGVSSRATEADAYAPKPAIPPGYRLVHGDVLERETQPEGAFRNDPNRYWPGGVVPYEFDGNVSAANQTAMIDAMAEWEAVATTDFVPRNGQSDYVHIQNSTGNNSEAGRAGGQQIINITSWGSRFIIVHELGHCLGYWHTQSRPDRDNFVQINTGNIQSGKASQFQIESDIATYGPYDFDSVMHYDQCAFSTDCPAGATCGCVNTTITVLAPNQAWQTLIGQRNHLSAMDGLTMSLLYPPGDWRFVDRSFTGTPNSGTFLRPYRTFIEGKNNVPVNGTVALQPGSYAAVGTHMKAMTCRAPLGGVTLGN